MDIEWLREYEATELHEFEEHKKRLLEGRIETFPADSRFKKLSKPVASRTFTVSLWSQIPMFGSLLINVLPVQKEKFALVNRFDLRELDRLIDLCKDTGRVQFVLADLPTMYAGLDFLDPLFSEIRPPLRLNLGPTYLATEQDLREWAVEFDELAQFQLYPLLRRGLGEVGHSIASIDSRYREYMRNYCNLRILGYAKVANFIRDSMISDPYHAWMVLIISDRLLTKPVFDPMKAIYCYSTDELRGIADLGIETGEPHKNIFPAEVGSILMKELAPVPESLEASMALIDRYRQDDLQKVILALEEAVKEGEVDTVKMKSADVSEIVSNAWKEANKIGTKAKGISYGASIILSASGYISGELLAGGSGGTLGLLAGLGFQLIDKSIDEFSPSEKLAKFVSRGYLGAIFDFKKKYRLLDI